MSAELSARCTAAAAALADYRAELASAPLTRPPGREWMLRLASVLEDLLAAHDEDGRQLGEVRAILAAFNWESDDRQYALEAIEMIVAGADDEDQGDEDDETFACSACGATISIFLGLTGWRHYRGNGTAASPVELYDAGHEATP